MKLVCDLFIDGHIEGSVTSQKAITIGKNGTVSGDLSAERIIIHGRVEGSVDAERVEIKEAGQVTGTLIYRELLVEAQGRFEGESRFKGAEGEAGKTSSSRASE